MPTSQQMADLFDKEIAASDSSATRRERCLDEHGYGCGRIECGRGPHGVVTGLRRATKTEIA